MLGSAWIASPKRGVTEESAYFVIAVGAGFSVVVQLTFLLRKNISPVRKR